MGRLTKKAKAQLERHLSEQAPERLVELLMAQVASDPRLRDELLLEVVESGAPLDVASFRRSMADALRSSSAAGGRNRPPRTSGAWARNVHDAVKGIAQLLDAGKAEAVVEITEYALGRVDAAMSKVDDSSGWFRDIVAELEGLHHRACVTCRPEPVALARRLFAFDVDGDWDIFIDSVERYADVLGDEGIAEMRRLGEERWARLPAIGPGERHDRATKAFHLSRMMEKLADQAGDVDARVAVMSRELSYPYDYVKIAEVLIAAGRHDDALEWAETGIAAFDATDHPMRGDTRLDDVVLGEYVDHGRRDDVVALVNRRFEERPRLATFERLQEWSAKVGAWDDLRPAAMARLEDDARRAVAEQRSAGQVARRRWGMAAPASSHEELIAVLLHEGDVDAAWSAASENDCSPSLWLELARAREDDHPLEAAGAYAREVEALISTKRARDYEAAVEQIVHIQELHHRAGDHEGFASYLAELRQRHKPKRKLIGLIDSGLVTP
jgi:hypothetical protein